MAMKMGMTLKHIKYALKKYKDNDKENTLTYLKNIENMINY